MTLKYPKELLQWERYVFAATKAIPEIKAAHDAYSGLDLVEKIEEIEVKYGLNAV